LVNLYLCLRCAGVWQWSCVSTSASTRISYHRRAVNPELIPDLTAYRLWFVSVSRGPNPSDAEVQRQSVQLNKTRLVTDDQKVLIGVLTTFKIQYQSLIQSFNEEATSAWSMHENPNFEAFVLQRDLLVQSTRDSLKGKLSPGGLMLLDVHVQSEKRHMHVSGPTGGGQ
jgi:hypothetical protein